MKTEQQNIWIDDAAEHLDDAAYVDFVCGANFWHERATILEQYIQDVIDHAYHKEDTTCVIHAQRALAEYRGDK